MKLIGVAFIALAIYLFIQSVVALVSGHHASPSVGMPMPYETRANTETTCLILSRSHFEELLATHPQVSRRWLTSSGGLHGPGLPFTSTGWRYHARRLLHRP